MVQASRVRPPNPDRWVQVRYEYRPRGITDRQTDGQKDKQAGRQIDRQTDRRTDGRDGQVSIQTDRKKER